MGSLFLARVITGFGNIIIMLICLQAIMSWFVSVFPNGCLLYTSDAADE